jgi:hypothetical protein
MISNLPHDSLPWRRRERIVTENEACDLSPEQPAGLADALNDYRDAMTTLADEFRQFVERHRPIRRELIFDQHFAESCIQHYLAGFQQYFDKEVRARLNRPDDWNFAWDDARWLRHVQHVHDLAAAEWMRAVAALDPSAILQPYVGRPAFNKLQEDRLVALPPAVIVAREVEPPAVAKPAAKPEPQPVAVTDAAILEPPAAKGPSPGLFGTAKAEPDADLAPSDVDVDGKIDDIIDAAHNSLDRDQSFRRLLHLAGDWSRAAWADAAMVSESTISRWIGGKRVGRSSNKSIRNALHQRLRTHWPSVAGITFDQA